MDIVLNVKDMPKVGETIFSTSLSSIAGGKGANQAVAASRLGSKIFMIGKVGKDANGKSLVSQLENDYIDVSQIIYDDKNPTGTAIITVDSKGNNTIIVVSGSNMNITVEDIKKASPIIEGCSALVAQFETPLEATLEAFKIAKNNNITTILNPAPAKEICEELLKLTDIIIPNETEAFEITKIQVENEKHAMEAGQKLIEKGVKYVIVTLGEKGAALVSADRCEIIPAYKVEAVDTTAAGDSFIGALAGKLKLTGYEDYENIKKAIKFANKVSSIAVQKKGAQPSLPTLEEVIHIYGEEE